MTTQMRIKAYLVIDIKTALLNTTGIKLASKSETTSRTYQHQALIGQLRELMADTDLNKSSCLNLNAFQKRNILATYYIAKPTIRTKNLNRMTKVKQRLESIYSSVSSPLCLRNN